MEQAIVETMTQVNRTENQEHSGIGKSPGKHNGNRCADLVSRNQDSVYVGESGQYL